MAIMLTSVALEQSLQNYNYTFSKAMFYITGKKAPILILGGKKH